MIKELKNIIKKLFLRVLKIEEPNKFVKISYAQSGEDLIIKYLFDNIGIHNPSYLDIGAHHPFHLNNTAIFYNSGSRGINIEPDSYLFNSFKIERNEDINLNIGVGVMEGIQDFFIINDPVLNTFSKKEAEGYSNEGKYFIKEIRKIDVKTINQIIITYSNGIFPDLLTIDAEGIDEVILNEINFEGSKPIIICIETISFSMSGNGIKNTAIPKFLDSKGYLLYADTNINSIFILEDKWIR
ncbi:MAG: FkbM family methyltransferase [Ferruginibacter sp.]|nr:FkbM family methyltransferase [Ferruginibacter sp.]